MKCPKCGSENTSIDMMLSDSVWLICQCGNDYQVKNSKLHQQRLDKVLAKFINNGVYHYYVIHDNLDICYYKNNFSMLGNKESFGSPYEINISLDTVEHLITDMETK